MRTFVIQSNRGVEQLVARRAHNPEAGGSSPSPATKKTDVEKSASVWRRMCAETGELYGENKKQTSILGKRCLLLLVAFLIHTTLQRYTNIFDWQGFPVVLLQASPRFSVGWTIVIL